MVTPAPLSRPRSVPLPSQHPSTSTGHGLGRSQDDHDGAQDAPFYASRSPRDASGSSRPPPPPPPPSSGRVLNPPTSIPLPEVPSTIARALGLPNKLADYTDLHRRGLATIALFAYQALDDYRCARGPGTPGTVIFVGNTTGLIEAVDTTYGLCSYEWFSILVASWEELRLSDDEHTGSDCRAVVEDILSRPLPQRTRDWPSFPDGDSVLGFEHLRHRLAFLFERVAPAQAQRRVAIRLPSGHHPFPPANPVKHNERAQQRTSPSINPIRSPPNRACGDGSSKAPPTPPPRPTPYTRPSRTSTITNPRPSQVDRPHGEGSSKPQLPPTPRATPEFVDLQLSPTQHSPTPASASKNVPRFAVQADDGEGSEGVPAAKGVDRKGKGRAEPQVDIEEGVQKTGTVYITGELTVRTGFDVEYTTSYNLKKIAVPILEGPSSSFTYLYDFVSQPLARVDPEELPIYTEPEVRSFLDEGKVLEHEFKNVPVFEVDLMKYRDGWIAVVDITQLDTHLLLSDTARCISAPVVNELAPPSPARLLPSSSPQASSTQSKGKGKAKRKATVLSSDDEDAAPPVSRGGSAAGPSRASRKRTPPPPPPRPAKKARVIELSFDEDEEPLPAHRRRSSSRLGSSRAPKGPVPSPAPRSAKKTKVTELSSDDEEEVLPRARRAGSSSRVAPSRARKGRAPPSPPPRRRSARPPAPPPPPPPPVPPSRRTNYPCPDEEKVSIATLKKSLDPADRQKLERFELYIRTIWPSWNFRDNPVNTLGALIGRRGRYDQCEEFMRTGAAATWCPLEDNQEVYDDLAHVTLNRGDVYYYTRYRQQTRQHDHEIVSPEANPMIKYFPEVKIWLEYAYDGHVYHEWFKDMKLQAFLGCMEEVLRERGLVEGEGAYKYKKLWDEKSDRAYFIYQGVKHHMFRFEEPSN